MMCSMAPFEARPQRSPRVRPSGVRAALRWSTVGAVAAAALSPGWVAAQPVRGPAFAAPSESTRRDRFEVFVTLAAVANQQSVLNTELRKNGFSEAGMARPLMGWGIALSVWRCRLALELAEARVWSTMVRRASDGAYAEVWPTLDSLEVGYEVYVDRQVAVMPILGLAWGGATIDLDPKASPLAPQAWAKFANVPRKTVDALSFAVKLGIGVEHFFPFVDPRRPVEPGTPGLVFDTRIGYLAHFADGAWITKDGDSTYVVEGAPVASIGGFFLQMALGIGFAKEKR